MDVEKLIRRLRNDADAYRNGETLGRAFADQEDVLDNAATALSTLQAENEKLRAELDNYRSSHCSEGGCAAEKDRDLVIAENKKLRAELERVKVERDAYQVYFKDLSSKPDCNTCEKRNCDYRPKLGATVRVNCPLYSGPQKEE